jgi:hypothetical protein
MSSLQEPGCLEGSIKKNIRVIRPAVHPRGGKPSSLLLSGFDGQPVDLQDRGTAAAVASRTRLLQTFAPLPSPL